MKAPDPETADDAKVGDAQQELSAAAGDVVLALQPNGVMGTLTQMTLTEIVQMMDFGKKTARVDVFLQSTRGSVHIHDGQIVRATATTSSEVYGEPAFLMLARETKGFFHIHYERVDVERNVQRPTTFVLLDALRLIDEAAAASGGAPPDATNGNGNGVDDVSGAYESAFAGAFDEENAGTPAAQAPRTKEPRYRCALDVEVDGVALTIEDIGLGGAFIRSDEPRDPPSTIGLRLVDRDELPPLELAATVMHSVDAAAAAQRGRAAGMGVRFEWSSMSDEGQARLRDLVEAIATFSPELGDAPPPPPPSSPPSSPAPDALTLPTSSMLDSIADVDFHIATGDLKSAQRVLLQAQQTAPDDEDVRRRLQTVNAQIEAAHAIACLQQAERLVGKPEAVDLARRATQLRPSREMLLRALAVFAQARSSTDVADVAGRLMELDPEDEGAIRTWLDANIELQRWNVAVRTAEALLRRRPGDEQLKKLLERLVQRARNR